MHNSIILFGSVYLISKSLQFINILLLENKKMPHELILINGLAFAVSSSIFIGGGIIVCLSAKDAMHPNH